MSAWDPWWAHGDYAETYHGAPDGENDEPEGQPPTPSLEEQEDYHVEV